MAGVGKRGYANQCGLKAGQEMPVAFDGPGRERGARAMVFVHDARAPTPSETGAGSSPETAVEYVYWRKPQVVFLG